MRKARKPAPEKPRVEIVALDKEKALAAANRLIVGKNGSFWYGKACLRNLEWSAK